MDINPVEEVPQSKLILGEKAYAITKFVAMILLPAIGTAYFTLAQIWEWSNGEKVLGTIIAVDTFLGVLLGISTNAFNKSDANYSGTINLYPNVKNGTTDMTFSVDPNKLAGASKVTLKVNSDQTS